ncbi:putative phage abortive infection protein [Chryseobacterium kwangjuense]|uniref:Phage abortive infection protein n=1 Tax=Chryseobacterium kwangjuense TaxID=267125 RepID=A0ABW9JY69_9FLAO
MEKFYQFLFEERTASKVVIFGLMITLLMLLLFLIKGSWNFSFSESIGEDKIGQFGDFVGGFVGTLFSLVGVILFYVSLKEQRADFRTNQDALENQLEAFQQQIKEFELQREELSETRKIFEQQTKTMKNQQFESSFYSLLNVFIDNRNRISALNLFKTVITNIEANSHISDYTPTIKSIYDSYFNEYMANRAELAMYFMSLYRLFKIIEECPHLDNSEKIYYHKIIRALISKDELLVLYYNYQSEFGKNPLPIALKYNYFKHLEVLSKVEFSKTFELNARESIEMNKTLSKVRNLVYSNLEKAKELSEDDIIEEIQLYDNIFIGIYISDIIEIRLIIKNKPSSIAGINESKFKNILTYILVDILYTSQFKKFDVAFLEESTTTTENQVIYNFKFETPDE